MFFYLGPALAALAIYTYGFNRGYSGLLVGLIVAGAIHKWFWPFLKRSFFNRSAEGTERTGALLIALIGSVIGVFIWVLCLLRFIFDILDAPFVMGLAASGLSPVVFLNLWVFSQKPAGTTER